MGVLNKLKGRMSGYNALTKGPAKHHGPAHCDVDYMHSPYWNDMRKRNAPGPGKTDFEALVKKYDRGSGSGVSAVEAGLAAGKDMFSGVQHSDVGGDVAGTMAGIGEVAAMAVGNSDRKKELDGLQKANKGMTRGEARKKRRSINKYLKNNDLTDIKF